jgi:glycosyltransferase involved in cell wall biosynthesis
VAALNGMAGDPLHTKHRVARVITRLNIGGPSIQATRLTSALGAHGYTTRLFHGRLGAGEGDMSYLLDGSADAVFIPTLCRPVSPFDDLRTLVRLYRELRRYQPHIVHTHMAKAGLLGRLAATAYNLTRGSAPRARIVHTYHGHVLEGYFGAATTAVIVSLERLLARASDTIIAISPQIRRELLDGFRIGRDEQYRLVPLGFDLKSFADTGDQARVAARRELGLPAGVPVITTVGRLTAIKQHRLFLDIVQQVALKHPALVALIVGDGELRTELEAYAASIGMAERVRFLGWRRDLATIYGATDVFLLTSRNEGTPVALIEAMATAVPGVSTEVGGVKDVIDSPRVGLLAADGDVAALAAAVSRLLENPDERVAMGTAARAAVLGRYGFERLVGDIAHLYGELLARS